VINNPQVALALGLPPPKLLLLEGWNEHNAGVAIAQSTGIDLAALQADCISVRNYPGTVVNKPDNPVFGKTCDAIMAPKLDVSLLAPLRRDFDAHLSTTIASGLYNNKTGIVENFQPQYFTPTHFIDKFGYSFVDFIAKTRESTRETINSVRHNLRHAFDHDKAAPPPDNAHPPVFKKSTGMAH
jgi:hypothetical protein